MKSGMVEHVPPSSSQLSQEQDNKNKGFWRRVHRFNDSVRLTAFVLGTAIICFIAARNTLIWGISKFWGVSGSFWQSQWDKVYDVYGGDSQALGVWGLAITTTVVFFGFNAFLMFMDLTGQPEFLVRYKIQDAKEVPLPPWKLWQCLRVVLFNHFVIGGPLVVAIVKIMHWRGCSFERELPTFHWVLLELLCSLLVEEVMFYYSHRMLHMPCFYKRIHKKHHEWTASIGIVAQYSHPVECALSNIIPAGMGPIIMGSHIATSFLWMSIVLIGTSISHSGYHIPFLPSSEAHDFHHLKFNNIYGVLGIMDRLHGTDKMFRASKQYQRHYLSLNTTPLKELIPDDVKAKNGKAQ